jgi:cysteine desulfurase
MASNVIKNCKIKISKNLNCKLNEIIFTGSGTESDNLAILGIARAYKKYGNHIIISTIEHKAVLEAAKLLKFEGFEISFIPVDSEGVGDIEKLKNLICEKTILVSIMYANNEIGTIQPINYISNIIKERRISSGLQFPFLHTDACQAVGYLELDTEKLGVDLMTLNGSKIYGPKGIGILFKKEKINIKPIIVGGEQENNLRAGTESLPLIFGLTEALDKSCKLKESETKRLGFIRDYFISQLRNKIPDLIINGHRVSRLPNNVHVSIPNIEGESMLLMLDKYGIEASTGSACSSYDLTPSHVLLAIGQTAEFAHGSIRFSMGRSTTKKDIDYVLSIFPNIVQKLKSISSLTIKKYEKTK